ncbi:type III secretion HpaP family protein [Cupriavidus pampae]|nr:type III secretion HpaP family protein [Cupriavidus pampae]
MTRNHLPMPPVRIVPAPTANERASAEHDAQSREAGNRFRRLLDAQQRRAAAPALTASLAAALHGHASAEHAEQAAELPMAEHEAARQHDPLPETPNNVRDAERQPHEAYDDERRAGMSADTNNSTVADSRTSDRRDTQPGPGSALDFPRAQPQPSPARAHLTHAQQLPQLPAARERDAGQDSGPRMGDTSRQDGDAHDGGGRTFQPAFVTQLERDVVEFCGASGLSLEGAARTVTLTPDPRILPDTQLTITISPDALSLRFHCESARSRELLCLHGDTLKARLVLRTGRTVDLEVVAG